MPAEINYKKKYKELKLKYMNSVDLAFRLGYEQGAQEAKQQQSIEAEANAQQMKMQQDAAQAGGMPNAEAGGQPPQEGGVPEKHVGGAPGKANENPSQEGQPMTGSSGNGSEIDQHINKLQGMIGKGHSPQIQKTLQEIIDLRKAEKLSSELAKSQAAIPAIAKALHKPAYKMGAQASHNMNDSAKQALTLQHKIVSDVMQKWEKEETKASTDIKNILNIEGIIGE